MRYYFTLSLRYMRKNFHRTLYSVAGIVVCVILLYGVLLTGFGYWDYICQESYDASIQLRTAYDCTKEMIEKLSEQEQIKALEIQRYGEYEDDDADRELTVDRLEEGGTYGAYIELKDPSDLKRSAEQITQETGVNVYADEAALVALKQEKSSDVGVYNAILSLIAALFCAFSIVILRNIMTISVVERMRDYGLLRCVGMSKRQLNTLLISEGMIMSGIATAAGIVLGYGVVQGFACWVNDVLFLEPPIRFSFDWPSFLITVFLSFGVTLFSLLEPARQAGLLSPLEALHNNITLRRGKNRKKQEKIRYHKGGVWGKFFGISGEYAYKNMMRTRGRQINLYVGILVCVILMGSINSFTDSLHASVDRAYQGKHNKYAEIIVGSGNYSAAEAEKLQEDIGKIKGVRETGLIFTRTVWKFYDKNLEQKVTKDGTDFLYISYGYDDADLEALQPYLLEGQISCEKMKQENGVIICDTRHDVQDDKGNLTSKRCTDYQVGDTITMLSPEGRKKQEELFQKIIPAVNRKLGRPEDSDLYDAEVQKKKQAAKQRRILWKTICEVLAEEGVDIRSLPEEAERKQEKGTNTTYAMLNEVGRILYEQGYQDEYVIQGIVSEDIHNGGDIEENYLSYLEVICPQERMIEEIQQGQTSVGPFTGYYAGQADDWGIGVNRDTRQINNLLEQYCNENEIGYYISNLDEFMGILEFFQIVKLVGTIISACIVIGSLFQIYNLVCMNMALRQKELWLYGIVGMTRRQKRKMVILENSLPGLSAIFTGLILSCGLSWYIVDYLLNQDGTIVFSYPVLQNLGISFLFLLLIVLDSALGMYSRKK